MHSISCTASLRKSNIEQEEIDRPYTLQILVNSNISVNTDHGDVWRDEDARVLTASLNPDRFSQAAS
jgi:hypothetical protein